MKSKQFRKRQEFVLHFHIFFCRCFTSDWVCN